MRPCLKNKNNKPLSEKGNKTGLRLLLNPVLFTLETKRTWRQRIHICLSRGGNINQYKHLKEN